MSISPIPHVQILHVIYADAVGYTRLALEEKHQFDSVLADSVAQVSMTTNVLARVDNGDGFALVLDGNPETVLKIALELRTTIIEGSDVLVRFGLHTGPAFLRPDLSGAVSITGNAIEHAQRVMGLSDGTSIVCSEAFAGHLLGLNPSRADIGLPVFGTSKNGEFLTGFEIGRDPVKQCLVFHDNEDFRAREIAMKLKAALPSWNVLHAQAADYTDSVAAMLRYRARAGTAVIFDSFASKHLLDIASKASCFSSVIRVDEAPVRNESPEVHVTLSEFLEVNVARLQIAIEGGGKSWTHKGPLPVGSPLYLVRDVDRELETALLRQDSVILLKAPKGYGKSSAILRLLKVASGQKKQTIVIDTESADESVLQSPTLFYRWLIGRLFEQCPVKLDLPVWEEWLGPNSNLEKAMKVLLKQNHHGTLVVFDGMDRLFDYSFRDDFFGLLRSWHNARAMRDDEEWSMFSMLLSYSAEGQSFVSDVNQSPFNIGTLVVIKPLSQEETLRLALLFGFANPDLVFEVTRGHPTLTVGLLAATNTGGDSITDLTINANQRFLRNISKRLAAFKGSELGRELDKCTDQNTLWVLFALGVLSAQGDGTVGYANPVFKRYFEKSYS